MMYENILAAIGNTPLVRVNLAAPAQVYAKLEYLNPGGSLKDRSALFMVENAERAGILKPGGTIIDASSGNHGIAIAMIGALKGYRVIITTTPKFSQEKLSTIRAYGAEIVMCPATDHIEHPESYHSTAVRLHRETPNSFMPNQYYNVANAHAHHALLGPEIWRQTEGRITHFFAGAGTGGTVSGVGRYLKEQNPAVKIIALDSVNSLRSTNGCPRPYKIEGIGVDFANEVLDPTVIDEFVTVTDEQALGMLPLLARQHGLLIGPSSGAVAYGVHAYGHKLTPTDLVVMICGDSGRAYLSKYWAS